MEAVLVTGGAGFIGSNLVRQLVADAGRHVINLDKLTYAGNLDSLSDIADRDNYEFVHADIADRERVARVLRSARPSVVFNLAAESHVDRSIDGPLPFVVTNVLGTCCLLEEVLGYWQSLESEGQASFRFVHISTDEVFGELGASGEFSEVTPYAPNSPYSASKASSDHFVRAYQRTFGLPTVITNCSNNYGPRQFPEKLVPLMILNAIAGRALPVYGDGLNVRDWLFVDDHCQALRLVAKRGVPGETYLIGGNCEKTNLEVVRGICNVVSELCGDLAHDPEDLITFVADRPGHDHRYAVSIEKIERELGWRPSVSLDEGMRQTVRWYLDNQDWVRRVTSGEYRGERLGLKGNS